MSGGIFDYKQYYIDDIVAKIEYEIERATCKRPPVTIQTSIAVSKEYYNNNHKYYSYVNNYNFKTLQEAKEYFELLGYSINDKKDDLFEAVKDDSVFSIFKYTNFKYLDENGDELYFPNYSSKTLEELKKGVEVLKKASIYAHRIDWLLSEDDGEESFYKRLQEDLFKLKKKKHNKTI